MERNQAQRECGALREHAATNQTECVIACRASNKICRVVSVSGTHFRLRSLSSSSRSAQFSAVRANFRCFLDSICFKAVSMFHSHRHLPIIAYLIKVIVFVFAILAEARLRFAPSSGFLFGSFGNLGCNSGFLFIFLF